MEAVEVADDVIHEDLLDSDSSEGSIGDEGEIEVAFEVDFFDPYDRQDEEDIGGYEYEFVDEVSDSQKCPVCLLPMRDAVQTSECGHRFCKDCLQRILRDDHPVCPNDRREFQEEGGYFYDKAWARDILSLRVKCKRSDRGCDWIGQLRHAEGHKGECDYEDVNCLACGVDIQRRLKETHHNEECPKRIIECVYCQDEFTFIQKQEHEDTYCKRFPLVCTNSCGREEIPREEMDLHLSDECPMTEVICPYAKAGCPFQDKRAHLNDHIEASVEDHLELTWSSLAATKQELHDMKDLRQKYHQMQEVNQELTESIADSRDKIRDLTLAVKGLEMQNIQQMKWMENTDDLRQKSHQLQEANQKLTESMADSRKEVRSLTLAMKKLEMQNIQQKKWMEEMARKMAKEMPTEFMADSRKEVRDLKLAMKNLEIQNMQQKKSVEASERRMKMEIRGLELHMLHDKSARDFQQALVPIQKSVSTVTLGIPPTGMSPSEESKNVQDITGTNLLSPFSL